MRSTDGGATWSSIFNWGYPPPNYVGTRTPFYNFDVSRAPWISTFATGDTKQIGWMIEGLSIDPFDSDHWLYGTGLTVYGGRDLTNWDANPRKNITVASLATGIEETAVLDLTAPISGPLLISAVGDVGGFVHSDLTKPSPTFTNPIWAGVSLMISLLHGTVDLVLRPSLVLTMLVRVPDLSSVFPEFLVEVFRLQLLLMGVRRGHRTQPHPPLPMEARWPYPPTVIQFSGRKQTA